ncbi:MAG TPA: hypothetical protein VL202_00295 [Pararhizobium sp.]|uniref:hypothetical protein n=1 Tax=Pararhizobium sp. TaxID=1977563 RepID=UPI002BB81146|nr:hypothetical protein [Pararhizobium sp.]HTO29610.1 hypothetical protein [Pararhizobium sp.]
MALDLQGVGLSLPCLVDDDGRDKLAESADDIGVRLPFLHGDDLRQALDVLAEAGDRSRMKFDDV